jgi:hypothetical protein
MLLVCSVLLKMFFQSKGMLIDEKLPEQSSRNRVDGERKLLTNIPERKVKKKNHVSRSASSANSNGKASKQAMMNTAKNPISSAPSRSNHPTPTFYLVDDDSYYNRTTTPTKSPVQINPSNQMLATLMPTVTLLPNITQTRLPTTAFFPPSFVSVSGVNSLSSSNPSAILSQASSEYSSVAPSLLPTFYPSATPTKPISTIARKWPLMNIDQSNLYQNPAYLSLFIVCTL